jgi:hypothetical protein
MLLSCYIWCVCFIRLCWFSVSLFHFIYDIRVSYLNRCLTTNSMFFLSAAVFKLCFKDSCTSRCSSVCESGGGGSGLSSRKRPTWSTQADDHAWWYMRWVFLCDDFILFWNVIQSLGVARTHEMMEKRCYNVFLIHFK